MENSSPWDQPWGGPRRGHRGGSWSGGPPPWVEGLINLARSGPGDFGSRGSRGPKVRRGDVRAAILDVLAVEPMNGYQIIQQIAERSGGAWKPSPGSVYPTVQQLEDEGLVEGTDGEGRRLLTLTEEGRRYVEEHPDEMARTWAAFDAASEEGAGHGGPGDLKPSVNPEEITITIRHDRHPRRRSIVQRMRPEAAEMAPQGGRRRIFAVAAGAGRKQRHVFSSFRNQTLSPEVRMIT